VEQVKPEAQPVPVQVHFAWAAASPPHTKVQVPLHFAVQTESSVHEI